MKKISIVVFALFTASLWIPQNAAAQAYPAPAGDSFRQEGIASWYGTEFDGRPTASGEIFNSSQFTAAHPSLPFGTYLLVTNRHNNRQVAVRINDRGPFAASRIIDVSRAAAEQLDMLTTGTAPVLLEAIQTNRSAEAPAYQQQPAQPQQSVYTPVPAQPQSPYTPVPAQPQQHSVYPQSSQQPQVIVIPMPHETPGQESTPITITIHPPTMADSSITAVTSAPAAPAPAPAAPIPAAVMPPEAAPRPESLPSSGGARLIPAITPAAGKTYRLQVGSYRDARNAVTAYGKLRDSGLKPDYERNGELYRVVLKGIRGTEVQSVAEKLGTAGFHEAVIKEE